MKKNMALLLKIIVLIIIAAISGIYACKQVEKQKRIAAKLKRGIETVTHPEWSKNAIIYEVNIRQITPEGTFGAFSEHIPRLKELGVDILWLMPINAIGEKNRKGKLGSYYSVKDYKSINDEFGTMSDFKDLVDKVHDAGMYLIIDWVPNHTAWDHIWVASNPEFYTKDSLGNFKPPVADWEDVIELDFDNEDMQNAMIDAMLFWINEANIDGYRCDVAHGVPVEFWNKAVAALKDVKHVFMLAEAEGYQYHQKAFDMTYAWELHHLMNEVAKGKKKVKVFDKYYAKEDSFYLKNDYRMQFTSNHDENSWNGTVYERMGDAAEIFAVFTYIIPGMPLIYNGQEAGLDKRLRFFEKDTIEWKGHYFGNLYRQLNQIKKENPALWNGEFGGDMERICTSNDSTVFAIVREKDDNKIIGIFNFSKKDVNLELKSNITGTYSNMFSEEEIKLEKSKTIQLDAWGYLVLKKE
ncbi:MAG: alpha-glucosidase C-terminal domain-containing protein [Bacteroidales bacterium]|nr:alpha-glucosidase C-terminal domain-containing protein [Bacteroidales bacterium]